MATRQLHKILNLRCLSACIRRFILLDSRDFESRSLDAEDLVALSMNDERRSAGDQINENLKSYKTTRMFRWASVSKSLTEVVVSPGLCMSNRLEKTEKAEIGILWQTSFGF